MDARTRIVGRRVAFSLVVLLQLGFVVRGYMSDHKEFAFQMFNESSDWRADIDRVTADGRRIPIEEEWSGYRWNDLIRARGMVDPAERKLADTGIDIQLASFEAALDYVASHTPRDTETRYLEATVTYWHNAHEPKVVVLRSADREEVQ
ncbi:MAG: hypothetical protein ACRDV7_11845 [Acidimicrobiia bacterium]